MKRKLFTIVSLISLLLCVATVVMWARAQFTHDWVQLISETHVKDAYGSGLRPAISYTILTTSRRITIVRFDCMLKPYERAGYHREAAPIGKETWFGFSDLQSWLGMKTVADETTAWVSMPFWILGAATALFAVIGIVYRRSRWVRPGHCFELDGTTSSGSGVRV